MLPWQKWKKKPSEWPGVKVLSAEGYDQPSSDEMLPNQTMYVWKSYSIKKNTEDDVLI